MLLEYVYGQLSNAGETFDQFSFDREYLGRKTGYFASLKCTRKQPSLGVLFKLNRTLMKKHQKFSMYGIQTELFVELAHIIHDYRRI